MLEKILSKPTIVYCEPIKGWFIKRPYYALSNLAFFVVGVHILFREKGDGKLKTFGYLAVMISIFSTLYDVFDVYIFQVLDLSGMFVFASYLIFLNLSKIFKDKEKEIAALLSASVAISLIPLILIEEYSGDVIFGIFVLFILLTEACLWRKGRRASYKYYILAFSLFMLGFAFWLMDFTKAYCASFGLLNGRAVFHYLTAGTMYFLYAFYKNNLQKDQQLSKE